MPNFLQIALVARKGKTLLLQQRRKPTMRAGYPGILGNTIENWHTTSPIMNLREATWVSSRTYESVFAAQQRR